MRLQKRKNHALSLEGQKNRNFTEYSGPMVTARRIGRGGIRTHYQKILCGKKLHISHERYRSNQPVHIELLFYEKIFQMVEKKFLLEYGDVCYKLIYFI